jgi:NADPH:quinone reductase-like Zn-dependent oxidoreductase
MKLRHKIGIGFLAILGAAVIGIAMVLSHTAECPETEQAQLTGETMRVYARRCYGPAEVLSVEAVARPVPDSNEVLVRIHAAAINPLDLHYMRGTPYVLRLGTGIGAPHDYRLGVDFAGSVAATGDAVTKFSVGDQVFGRSIGAFGEYVAVAEDGTLAPKPANVSFEQAAGVPIAGVTASQALRGTANVQPGQRVLINGASGGVGTFAVQIAKSLGAEVTGVCSSRNVELVRSLGADHVIDYKSESYVEGDVHYDVIIDMVGNHSLSANRRVMTEDGVLVLVGGPKGDWLTPLWRPLAAVVTNPFADQRAEPFLAKLSSDDLTYLATLIESGQVTPVVDQVFPYGDLPNALRYVETGRSRGKTIVTVAPGPE